MPHTFRQSKQRVQLDPKTACATGSIETHPFDFKQEGGQDLGYVTRNGSVGSSISHTSLIINNLADDWCRRQHPH